MRSQVNREELEEYLHYQVEFIGTIDQHSYKRVRERTFICLQNLNLLCDGVRLYFDHMWVNVTNVDRSAMRKHTKLKGSAVVQKYFKRGIKSYGIDYLQSVAAI